MPCLAMNSTAPDAYPGLHSTPPFRGYSFKVGPGDRRASPEVLATQREHFTCMEDSGWAWYPLESDGKRMSGRLCITSPAKSDDFLLKLR